MDDQAPTENPPADFNKLDLSQLQSFSFGTQWTQDKATAGGGSRPPRDSRREDRPFRPRDGGGSGEPRRDRREFRRPGGTSDAGTPAGLPPSALSRRDDSTSRPHFPRGDERGGGPYGQRREDDRRDSRGYRPSGGYRERDSMMDRGPYISPVFTVTFYPEETSFLALAKAIRASNRTFELFEIARTVIDKNDRCMAVVQRIAPSAEAPAAAALAKPAPFAIAVPDGLPFETEEAAIAHVVAHHLSQFFDTTQVEIDPPKGNFQVINRCSVTGELLGPPNYHRYLQIVQQHYAARIRLPFEDYRARIETVRDPEVVNQWLAKMKTITRFTWKLALEGETAPSFDTLEEARQHLLTHARDKVVHLVETVRFPGKNFESLPPGEIRRATEGALERQRRFPLETANALRGRLRREGFSIFKKGSKGISYVCAVRRKFRVPGQVFADHIGALISFIEEHPMVKAGELPEKFLGLKPAPASPVAVPPPASSATGETPVAVAEGEVVAPPLADEVAPAATPASAALAPEDQQRLARLHGDLRWLVSEGYVMEFMDGRLFAAPPVAESRKQEAETAEHDPENFPDAPASPTPAELASPAVVNSSPNDPAAIGGDISSVSPPIADPVSAPTG